MRCVRCARRLCESPTSDDGVVGRLAFGVTCWCAAATTARSHRQLVADGKRTALVICAAFVRGVDQAMARAFRAPSTDTAHARTQPTDEELDADAFLPPSSLLKVIELERAFGRLAPY